jgi:hypothetical protein
MQVVHLVKQNRQSYINQDDKYDCLDSWNSSYIQKNNKKVDQPCRIVKLVHLGNCSLELVTIARRLSGWRQPTSPRFKPRPPLNSKRRRRFQLTFHPLRARDDDHSANRHIVKLLPAEMTAPGHGYIPRVLLSRPRFCIYKTQEF